MAETAEQLAPQVLINPNVANYPFAQPPAPYTANTSLYVGDLHPDVTENDLTEKFSQIGPLALVRVCRNRATNKSLEYGYVNFQKADDAERALDILNHDVIHGKPIRIMWSQRDPSIRKSGVGNIFIKNLSKNIDNKALYDTFSQFGYILSCKVALDAAGRSKGYGFIQYEKQSDAQNAIERVNKMQIDGKIVYVGPHKKSSERVGDSAPVAKFTNVYVKNIPETWDEEKLQDEFSKYGTVTSVKLIPGSLGKFGFVAYETTDAAEQAVTALNNKEVDGKTLFAGRAQKKSERAEFLRRQREKDRHKSNYPQGVNLYLKYLDDSITDEKLVNEFSQFGKVTSAVVKRDENGKSKGFGFVCFSTPEEATKATAEMTGKMLGSKPLYIRTHQSKQERSAFLADYHNRRARASMPPMYANQYPPQMYMYPPRPFPTNYRGTPMNYMRYPPSTLPRGPNNRPPRGANNNAAGNNIPGNKSFAQRAPYPGVRPPYMGMQMMPPMGAFQPPPHMQQIPFQQDNKEMLGNIIFTETQKYYPNDASKITGMLLEMDSNELIALRQSPERLKAKIDEAFRALDEYRKSQPNQ